MSRRSLVITVIISLIIAIGTLIYAQRSINRLMTVRKFPVAVAEIPPYTIVTADMLTEVELPKPLADQPIYTDTSDIIGKLTTADIPPGAIIYRSYAVEPATFRYVNDPALAVISFPVDPEKAVGGQVKIGQNIDIWRIRRADNSGGREAKSELLASSVPVVDVRSSKGERAGAVTENKRTQVESAGASREQVVPLTILSVAVDTDTAAKITKLMGEISGQYEVWVSLSTLTDAATTVKASKTSNNVVFVTATLQPTQTPAPPTATLSPVLAPASSPVPTLANPSATPTATPVPTLINPTATDTPTPVPTLAPPPTATPIPTATPEWDYSVVIIGDDILENEGPSFIQGTVYDIAGGSANGLPIELHWDGGSIPAATGEGGTFRFVVNAGEYYLIIPEYSVEKTRIVIPDSKTANRITLEVRQVR